MSPIEIAKAFDAPLLEHVDCNGTAESMLREVGKARVMYGDVGLSSGRPIDPLLGGGFGKVRRRLEVFDAGFVGVPQLGGEYHPSHIDNRGDVGEGPVEEEKIDWLGHFNLK